MPKSRSADGHSFFYVEEKMAFRVLLIESEVYVHLKLNNLVIEKEGNDICIG